MFLVDSNVLIDIATNDPVWWAWSTARLAECQAQGTLVVNPIIYAEVCPSFKTEAEAALFFERLAIGKLPLPYASAFPASMAFLASRKRGGSRTSALPDFFIGAHADVEDHILLTRDASRYRTYFPKLKVIAP
jgi:predicted nucleic acid-binding protein